MQKLSGLIRNSDFLLGLVILAFALLYGYHEIVSLEPQSVHQWRQADCTSMAWNYYQHSANFFTPSIHNQVLNDGHTAGEFPILYYVSGMLMRLLGPGPWIGRVINIVLLFGGLWAFSRTVKLVIRDTFWAVILPALLFTSPVLVYYGSTAMPEGPATGLVLWGWYCFFRFCEGQQERMLRWAIGLFALGMALKLSVGISYVAVFTLFFIEANGWGKFGDGRKLFSGKVRQYSLYFGISLALIVAWYIYADGYNTAHQVRYFLTGIRPISRVSSEEFSFIMQRFFGLNAEFAWFFPTHLLLIFLTFMGFSARGRQYPLLYSLSLLTFIGVGMYVLLFFKLFNVHDYYLVAMLIFPVMILLHGVYMLRDYFPQVEQSRVFRILVIGLLLANLWHAKGIMDLRYSEKGRQDIANRSLYSPELESFLIEKGVSPNARVISLPDDSPNSSLYLINRKGWSGYNVRQLPQDIEFYQQRGAGFLILHDPDLTKDPRLVGLLTQPLGNWEDVYVYRLPPP